MKGSGSLFIAVVFSLVILTASHVHAASPAQPTAVSPGGKVAGSNITFQWNPVSTATKYQLQVKSGSTVKYNRTFTEAQADCSEGTGTCSVEATIGNGAAILSWTVRAGNSGGFGEWSEAKSFTTTDEMRTPISKLPFTINNPGSFYVTGNLSSTGNGINVNAEDVTIDLCGYTITGPGSGENQGVYMNGRKNVEIKNGTIKNFGWNGIYEANLSGAGHRVIDVRVTDNGHNGVYLSGSRHLIENCGLIDNAWTGIYAALDSVIRNCVLTANDFGMNTGGGCMISGNNCSGNAGNGIFTGTGSSVIGNIVRDNGGHGIDVSANCTLKNNTVTENSKNGIFITTGYVLLDGNTVYGNNQSGETYPNISDCPTCQWGLNVK